MNDESEHLILYHFPYCPFCIEVRRVINKLNLKIGLRDIHSDDEHKKELVLGGGQAIVPCLKILDKEGNARWLYESIDIIQYLVARFGQKGK